MLGKKDNAAGRTIIDADTHISGDIQFAGDTLINGYVKGNVTPARGKKTATLTISERGCVEGSVVGSYVQVDGKVQGEVCATERLKLGPKAQAIGDLRYKLLEIAIGAKVDGSLVHEDKGLSAPSDIRGTAIPIQSRK